MVTETARTSEGYSLVGVMQADLIFSALGPILLAVLTAHILNIWPCNAFSQDGASYSSSQAAGPPNSPRAVGHSKSVVLQVCWPAVSLPALALAICWNYRAAPVLAVLILACLHFIATLRAPHWYQLGGRMLVATTVRVVPTISLVLALMFPESSGFLRSWTSWCMKYDEGMQLLALSAITLPVSLKFHICISALECTLLLTMHRFKILHPPSHHPTLTLPITYTTQTVLLPAALLILNTLFRRPPLPSTPSAPPTAHSEPFSPSQAPPTIMPHLSDPPSHQPPQCSCVSHFPTHRQPPAPTSQHHLASQLPTRCPAAYPPDMPNPTSQHHLHPSSPPTAPTFRPVPRPPRGARGPQSLQAATALASGGGRSAVYRRRAACDVLSVKILDHDAFQSRDVISAALDAHVRNILTASAACLETTPANPAALQPPPEFAMATAAVEGCLLLLATIHYLAMEAAPTRILLTAEAIRPHMQQVLHSLGLGTEVNVRVASQDQGQRESGREPGGCQLLLQPAVLVACEESIQELRVWVEGWEAAGISERGGDAVNGDAVKGGLDSRCQQHVAWSAEMVLVCSQGGRQEVLRQPLEDGWHRGPVRLTLPANLDLHTVTVHLVATCPGHEGTPLATTVTFAAPQSCVADLLLLPPPAQSPTATSCPPPTGSPLAPPSPPAGPHHHCNLPLPQPTAPPAQSPTTSPQASHHHSASEPTDAGGSLPDLLQDLAAGWLLLQACGPAGGGRLLAFFAHILRHLEATGRHSCAGHIRMAVDGTGGAAAQEQLVDGKDGAVADQEQLVDGRDGAVADQEQHVIGSDGAAADQEQLVDGRDGAAAAEVHLVDGPFRSALCTDGSSTAGSCSDAAGTFWQPMKPAPLGCSSGCLPAGAAGPLKGLTHQLGGFDGFGDFHEVYTVWRLRQGRTVDLAGVAVVAVVCTTLVLQALRSGTPAPLATALSHTLLCGLPLLLLACGTARVRRRRAAIITLMQLGRAAAFGAGLLCSSAQPHAATDCQGPACGAPACLEPAAQARGAGHLRSCGAGCGAQRTACTEPGQGPHALGNAILAFGVLMPGVQRVHWVHQLLLTFLLEELPKHISRAISTASTPGLTTDQVQAVARASLQHLLLVPLFAAGTAWLLDYRCRAAFGKLRGGCAPDRRHAHAKCP